MGVVFAGTASRLMRAMADNFDGPSVGPLRRCERVARVASAPAAAPRGSAAPALSIGTLSPLPCSGVGDYRTGERKRSW